MHGPLTSHQACGEFTEFAVARLHTIDPLFGHLKKYPGQTQYNGHAADAALYRLTGQAVDLILASKVASPSKPAQPSWSVDEPRYTAADWIDPKTLPPGDEEGDPDPPQKPKDDDKPHVCPVGVPKYPYDEQRRFTNEMNAAYQSEAKRPIHADLLSHLIWRYQFEDYSFDTLYVEAVNRGAKEA